MEINKEMKGQEKKKENLKQPKSYIIHVDQTADDSTLSGFIEQSWKVTFHYILITLKKILWVAFALISMKLYSTLLKIFKACIYKFFN